MVPSSCQENLTQFDEVLDWVGLAALELVDQAPSPNQPIQSASTVLGTRRVTTASCLGA